MLVVLNFDTRKILKGKKKLTKKKHIKVYKKVHFMNRFNPLSLTKEQEEYLKNQKGR